ncbi:hypothetical protein O1L55_10770 [Streptomyces albulus]|nr:hypothetical protein [Streptomyces noursei]
MVRSSGTGRPRAPGAPDRAAPAARRRGRTGRRRPAGRAGGGGGGPHPARRSRPRPWRLLPTPTGTPFTFCYAVLLVGTSLYADHGDPSVVSALLQGSSTDVVHLAQAPLLVLVASALWSAGGLLSGYALAFLFVLTALERRIGGVRSAAVFFGGHALATLATELPVGVSVAAGGLPDSSLHRLDYGISFGVMTCVGALAGLLPAWLRWPLLVAGGYQALSGLLAYADPMTDWGTRSRSPWGSPPGRSSGTGGRSAPARPRCSATSGTRRCGPAGRSEAGTARPGRAAVHPVDRGEYRGEWCPSRAP